MDEKQPLIIQPHRSKTSTSKCFVPCRYVLAILSFWGMSVTYSLRVNLSIALVAMVNSTFANANADLNKPECEGDGNTKTHNKTH
ncbi:Sialin [Exaiptasia diaphana]|nr:Sialin [Exaiptasia diaphana]